MRNSRRIIAALAAALVVVGCQQANGQGTDKAEDGAGETAVRPSLGLFTTLPLYWAETGDVSELITGAGDQENHARQALEKRYQLALLDTLEPEVLAGLDRILIAQPRPLAPSENVALDDWVRAGGGALILADPMLTRHSRYPLGDKRRPQDVVLLSPILARWGLELRFDEDQPSGERVERAFDMDIPVHLAGQFVAKAGGANSVCTLSNAGLIARCRVGAGMVTLLADSAVLDEVGGDEPGHSDADADAHAPQGEGDARLAVFGRLLAGALDF